MFPLERLFGIGGNHLMFQFVGTRCRRLVTPPLDGKVGDDGLPNESTRPASLCGMTFLRPLSWCWFLPTHPLQF